VSSGEKNSTNKVLHRSDLIIKQNYTVRFHHLHFKMFSGVLLTVTGGELRLEVGYFSFMRHAKIVTRHAKIVTQHTHIVVTRQVRSGLRTTKTTLLNLQKSPLLTHYDSLIIYALFLIPPSTTIHNNMYVYVIYIIYRVLLRCVNKF
jgi:hypothetical protein